MEKSIQDLTKKIDILLTKMASFEKMLTPDRAQPALEPIIKFQIGELESLKTELRDIKKILTASNQQVLDITIFNMLKQLESTASEIKESTGFVKNIFIQEKVQPVKKKLPKQEAINAYLLKYVKSMK